MARNTVEIDEDVFIDMLWNRVNEFRPAQNYDDDFWTECFDFLSINGWLDIQYNNPLYIVDNIAVNGEIYEKDDCINMYDEIINNYDGDVDEWISDNGYSVFGDYVVINLGL